MKLDSFPHSWGWSAFFESFAQSGLPEWKVARVINQEKGLYKLQVNNEKSQLAQLSGKFSFEIKEALSYPSVGDWVFYTHATQDERALIHGVLDRRSCFYRGRSQGEQVVASNMDFVLIVSSANSELNLNRLDRYLSVAWDSGALPVIVLSKTDLCQNLDELIASIEERHIGVPIVPITVMNTDSLEQLTPYLGAGKTVVLLGSSGVGKSTLTNALLGQELVPTSDICDDDKRGRHTTTSRQLYRLPGGALLMDTPGMRALDIGDHEEGLEQQFADIVAFTSECRFSDCQHETEPGCRIVAALESEELDPVRWKSYFKLQREIQQKIIREDPVLLGQQRKVWKKRSIDLRARLKQKSRGEI